jgi:NAD(P)-dependent dehydrogenase (short-subunit alcohol dehydrogenase family)
METAVVTGAGSGLGRAIALELADRGFLVHATDLDADAAARTAAEIGAGARSAGLDVRNEAACRALAPEATTRGGALDDLQRAGIDDVTLSAVCPDGIWTPMLEDMLDDLEAAGSFSGRLLTAEQVAAEVGKLTERPRPI